MTETERSLMTVIRRRYKRTHILLLDLVSDMTDAELRWQPQPPGNSVAWMLWHLGRFADGFQAELALAHEELVACLGDAKEVWFAEHLAAPWGLDAAVLGPTKAGVGMASDDALNLRLPDKKGQL